MQCFVHGPRQVFLVDARARNILNLSNRQKYQDTKGKLAFCKGLGLAFRGLKKQNENVGCFNCPRELCILLKASNFELTNAYIKRTNLNRSRSISKEYELFPSRKPIWPLH